MKPQDILFLGLLIIFIFLRKPKIFVWLGLISLVISIPLFAEHVFFTAERLTYYAAGFFLIAIILLMLQLRNENRN